MHRITFGLDKLKGHYDVVVIGSGYGGGIAASRLARAGRKVCVLERGKEFLPGEFPDTLSEATHSMQFNTHKERLLGEETDLFDFRVNDDINVLVGCGLGGTSLINANVVIEAHEKVLEDPAWPQELRADKAGFDKGQRLAREMLMGAQENPYPVGQYGFPSLPKNEAHQQAGEAIGEPFYRPNIAVTFKPTADDINHVGVKQTPCVNCGDCCSGCNYTSKNTVQMNYLPDAFNHGAEIFTETNVRYVERQNDKWVIHFEPYGLGRSKFQPENPFVTADLVVIAAGTLGSTEILLRSKARGFPVSDQLGKGFTGNGDVLAFAYNNDQKIDGIGFGTRDPKSRNPVGPTITGIIDTRKTAADYRDGMTIEEGAIPGALAPALAVSFSKLSKMIGQDTDEGFRDYLAEKRRELASLLLGAYRGSMRNTQTFLVMTHDSANGVMSLNEHDRLEISWPGVGDEPIFDKVRDKLYEITKALGGTFIPNPMWSERSIYSDIFGQDLVTVHPLGGCRMGDHAGVGVVNHCGQVYSGTTGQELHPDLFVADGAVIPTSVGTNPLLTISALAERSMMIIAEKHGWALSHQLPSKPPAPIGPAKPGIQFTETMRGHFSIHEKNDYQEAARRGEEDDSIFDFTLTVSTDDLETMLADENHEAAMFGTVAAPALSPEVLSVHGGVFNLFVKDPDLVDARKMRYRMRLKSQEGKEFFFEGFKVIKNDPGLDLWGDTTTLYITVYEGNDATGDVLGKGMLKIQPADFARQMTTMKVTGVDSVVDRLKYTAKFGSFFGGSLFDTYGGIAKGYQYFSKEVPPRKQRDLRADAPEIHEFKAKDGVALRLTRYQGGDKGPVILGHGLGVSSRIFSTDTIDTNLVEYLVENRYDVWLLDYRASIELPAVQKQSTGDQIAEFDYPAAVEMVRSITGAATVQMVVHCFGATTWTMSMLGGHLENVRSAVVSQVSTHAKPPFLTKLKTGLHVPSFLERIGIDSLTAYVDKESGWLDKMIDQSLRLYPIQSEERCHNPVCHRITFLYGHLYEHDQLNQLSHECLHEMFGIANISCFQHLGMICRKGHVVDFHGDEKYLPYAERMAIPITFISGAENETFLPESTELTYNFLRERNGKDLYKRHVIPNYGHIDCIFGKNAAEDVYPFIVEHLDQTA